MDDVSAIVAIEHQLAAGNGETYRRHLRDDAVVIVPGETLDKEATCAAIDASGGWDEFSLDDETVLQLGGDAAVLSYRFSGRRADFDYTALLATAYAREADGEWKVVFHQQTPLDGHD
jgi:ketosteroid isomerase-like protein